MNGLTEAEMGRLISDFSDRWSENTIRHIIEEALNHKASTKVKSLYLYCRGWLRREQAYISHPSASGAAPNRADYGTWETPRRAKKES